MVKIAVIGEPETVVGFKALGLETFSVREDVEASHVFHDLTRPDQPDEYAIIYLEERFAQPLKEDIDHFKDSPSPAVILIPGKDGSRGLGLSALQSAVERAVGANIL